MKKIIISICLVLFLVGCSVEGELTKPTNIRYEYDNIKWDEVKSAVRYEIEINDFKYEVNKNIFNMSEYEEGEYQVVVSSVNKANEKATSDSVVIVVNKTPKLISNNNIDYIRNQDIIVEFSLVYATFDGLSGNGIIPNDYTFDGKYLTIKTSFFESILTTNPTRQMVILSYSYSTDDKVTIGYLFIKIN